MSRRIGDSELGLSEKTDGFFEILCFGIINMDNNGVLQIVHMSMPEFADTRCALGLIMLGTESSQRRCSISYVSAHIVFAGISESTFNLKKFSHIFANFF